MRTPRITQVETMAGYHLRLTWDTGPVTVVDVSDVVNDLLIFAPLRDEPGLFDRASVGEDGFCVHWSDLMELSAPNLWQRSQAKAA